MWRLVASCNQFGPNLAQFSSVWRNKRAYFHCYTLWLVKMNNQATLKLWFTSKLLSSSLSFRGQFWWYQNWIYLMWTFLVLFLFLAGTFIIEQDLFPLLGIKMEFQLKPCSEEAHYCVASYMDCHPGSTITITTATTTNLVLREAKDEYLPVEWRFAREEGKRKKEGREAT